MPSTRKWVPENVARFVETAERVKHDDKSKERLRRLVSDPGMEAVWRTLSKEAPSPEVLPKFAQWAAFSLWLSWGPRLLPQVTNAARRRSAGRIEKLARGLLDEMGKPSGRFTIPANHQALVAGLSALVFGACYAAKAPRGPGPRKLAASTAVRTAYVQELDHFLKSHFKKPLYVTQGSGLAFCLLPFTFALCLSAFIGGEIKAVMRYA